MHVPGRGQPRRRDVRPSRGDGRHDGHPHLERRVRRALASRSARRRLRRLARSSRPHTRSAGSSESRPRGRRTCSPTGRCRSPSSRSSEGASAEVIGVPLRDAKIPRDSKVAAIIREDGAHLPGGDDVDPRPATGSSSSARRRRRSQWSGLLVAGRGSGARRRHLRRRPRGRGDRTRAARAGDRSPPRSRRRASRRARVAELLPRARVYQRDRARAGLPRARADRPGAGRDLRDERRREESLRSARSPRCTASGSRSRSPTSAVSVGAFEQAGIDVSVNPRRCHRRGDHSLRARPADEAGGPPRGESLRGHRRHACAPRASTSASRSRRCRSAARSSARSCATATRSSRTATTCSRPAIA